MKHRKIALGGVQFGLDYGINNPYGKTEQAQVKEIMDFALQHHINTIDTAYGYGVSEETIGNVANNDWKIISKFPDEATTESISTFLDKSCERLKRTHLEGYLAHDADTLLKNPHLWDELTTLKANQKVSKIGYSIYTIEQLEELLRLNMIPDIIQLPYSFFDRRFEPYFEKLKEHKVEIHTRSTFLQGIFFAETTKLNSFFDPIKPIILKLQQYYQSMDRLAAALLNFCLKNHAVDYVVIGINNCQQLSANLSALEQTVDNIREFDSLLPDEGIADQFILPYLWPKN